MMANKLAVFTFVLNGMPWLPSIFTVLNSLNLDWRWHIVEGAAMNAKCFSYAIEPQLSNDGTTEFLDSLTHHPRVSISRKELWQNEMEMANEAASQIKEHCVLMQIDSDEIWSAENIAQVYALLAPQQPGSAAQFCCRYFVGPHLVASGKDTYGNRNYEWIRAWRFKPGLVFEDYCPFVLQEQNVVFDREQTSMMGLTFHHYSWVTEANVAFKCKRYNYGSHDGWKALQSHSAFPAALKTFLPWADEQSTVDSIYPRQP